MIGIQPDVIDNVDDLIQQWFDETLERKTDSRYVVSLPWKENPST